MAKRKSATVKKQDGVVVVTPPAAIQTTKRRRSSSPAKRRAPSRRRRRGGHRIGGLGSNVGGINVQPLLAAAALGYAQKSGMKIPTLFNLSPEASAGLIAWGLQRFAGMPQAGPWATGMLSVAVHRWAAGQTPKEYIVGEGYAAAFDDDVAGDEYEVYE